MSETDRRGDRRGGSAKRSSAAIKAAKKSGGSEYQDLQCKVTKLPMGEGDDVLYSLTCTATRCNCKSDVDDYVSTIEGWVRQEDARLCSRHFAQLSKRPDRLRVESIEQVAARLEQVEAGA